MDKSIKRLYKAEKRIVELYSKLRKIVTGTGIPEAPINGKIYGRKDAQWTPTERELKIVNEPNATNALDEPAYKFEAEDTNKLVLEQIFYINTIVPPSLNQFPIGTILKIQLDYIPFIDTPEVGVLIINPIKPNSNMTENYLTVIFSNIAATNQWTVTYEYARTNQMLGIFVNELSVDNVGNFCYIGIEPTLLKLEGSGSTRDFFYAHNFTNLIRTIVGEDLGSTSQVLFRENGVDVNSIKVAPYSTVFLKLTPSPSVPNTYIVIRHSSFIPTAISSDFANDTAAAIGGIKIGEQYHTAGAVKVRLT